MQINVCALLTIYCNFRCPNTPTDFLTKNPSKKLRFTSGDKEGSVTSNWFHPNCLIHFIICRLDTPSIASIRECPHPPHIGNNFKFNGDDIDNGVEGDIVDVDVDENGTLLIEAGLEDSRSNSNSDSDDDEEDEDVVGNSVGDEERDSLGVNEKNFFLMSVDDRVSMMTKRVKWKLQTEKKIVQVWWNLLIILSFLMMKQGTRWIRQKRDPDLFMVFMMVVTQNWLNYQTKKDLFPKLKL